MGIRFNEKALNNLNEICANVKVTAVAVQVMLAQLGRTETRRCCCAFRRDGIESQNFGWFPPTPRSIGIGNGKRRSLRAAVKYDDWVAIGRSLAFGAKVGGLF